MNAPFFLKRQYIERVSGENLFFPWRSPLVTYDPLNECKYRNYSLFREMGDFEKKFWGLSQSVTLQHLDAILAYHQRLDQLSEYSEAPRNLLRLPEAFLKNIRAEETVLRARYWPSHELLHGSLSTYCRILLLLAPSRALAAPSRGDSTLLIMRLPNSRN